VRARRHATVAADAVQNTVSAIQRNVATYEVGLNDTQWLQIRSYVASLQTWNRRVSLVARADPLTLAHRHFLDSLAPIPLCRGARRIADIGSGAGFPGLVLAVALPNCQVDLIEANRKKGSFLADVISRAKISNAVLAEGRAESLAVTDPHHRAYDIVIARALGSLALFLQLAAPFLQPDGTAIAMKGPAAPEEVENLGASPSGFTAPIATSYRLPDGTRRVLLSFRRKTFHVEAPT